MGMARNAENGTGRRIAGCTCGCCRADADRHGNDDYGCEWNESLETYVARDCDVAREIDRLGKSGRDLYLDGHFRLV